MCSNIGFAFYAKFFTLSNSTSVDCTNEGGLGCDIYPAEGPTGQDLGTSGSWRFNLAQNEPSTNVDMDYTNKLAAASWNAMPEDSMTHNVTAGASSWADVQNRMFWTWTSPKDIEQSCADHMKDVGGVMVWSINQDTNGAGGGPHMAAVAGCLGGGSAGGDTGSSASTDALSTSAFTQSSASSGASTDVAASVGQASASATA
jgi:chitinase